jgi:hypothetical protein
MHLHVIPQIQPTTVSYIVIIILGFKVTYIQTIFAIHVQDCIFL